MDPKIPLFDLNFDKCEEKAVLEVIRSKWISTGPKTTEFENKFASMLRAKHSIALANCSVALHMAMKLLNIDRNDEVICPSLTFVATVNSVRYVNAKPVFADVKSFTDLTIDPVEIEKKVTPRTKAIVVMHYGGYSCDMERIMAIAEKHHLKVIEDACHGPLSECSTSGHESNIDNEKDQSLFHIGKGTKLGTIGDIGCFSFFSNKNISTGEGGMLVTNDDEIVKRGKLIRSHGMTSLSYQRAKGHSTNYDVVELGYNYRMDDIRASIGIVQLDKLQNDLEKRLEKRNKYIEILQKYDDIIIPFSERLEFSSNYIFPVILKNSNHEKREMVRKRLLESGIQTSVHYPAVHRFSFYKDFYMDLPKTDYISDNLITLPMFAGLSNDDIEYVCECLKRILNSE